MQQDVAEFDATAEYKALLELVRKKEPGKDQSDDAYQGLMQREKRVLDTVDRVVNDSWRKDADSRTFLQLPLHEIGARVMSTVNAVMEDAVEARTVRQAIDAVTVGDRKIYLGVFVIFLSLVLFFVAASS